MPDTRTTSAANPGHGRKDQGDPPPPARLPAEAVAGVTDLWRHTQGDPAVTIGVYDGPPDTAHPCLAGADLHRLTPWWLPPAPPFPRLVEHGTFTAGALLGQPGSALPGLAPRCRGLFVEAVCEEDVPADPLHAARAVDELVEAGADVIQFVPAFHTASGDADDMLKRSINRARQAGVLVVAPAGNDYGECGIAPAILPSVLAVGALRSDGIMYQLSNWGAPYRGHGIVAPGGDVLGALPGGGAKVRKGTCVAVTMVAGVAALLVSLQRHLGRPADPLAVGEALLRTARPCTPGQAYGEPERCLNGQLDLPSAIRLILNR
ncbi:S8 family serine peptidase [Streptosporangium sp. NPDC051022]|uniref:S8 family serine peptidase n=1 Tax=Streptosporangium sp. NPDC051022 TaxID=3155752 RepID=UPI003437DB3D